MKVDDIEVTVRADTSQAEREICRLIDITNGLQSAAHGPAIHRLYVVCGAILLGLFIASATIVSVVRMVWLGTL